MVSSQPFDVILILNLICRILTDVHGLRASLKPENPIRPFPQNCEFLWTPSLAPFGLYPFTWHQLARRSSCVRSDVQKVLHMCMRSLGDGSLSFTQVVDVLANLQASLLV